MDDTTSTVTPPSIIDETAALFMNRKQYSKYLEKKCPLQFEKQQQQIEKKLCHFDKIMDLTKTCLTDPNAMISNDIQKAFEVYCNVCIAFIETNEFNDKCQQVYSENDSYDEPELFGKMDSDTTEESAITHSYWGKSISKLNTPTTMLDHFIQRKK